MKNTIAYSGQVKITVKNKPYNKRSNSGTTKFFDFLCNLLAGNLIDNISSYVPVKIGMIHSNNNTITATTLDTNSDYNDYSKVSLLTSELHIVDRKVNGNTASVYYSTLLLHSQMKQATQTPAANSGICYALLLNNNNQILAYSPFEYTEIAPIWSDVNGQGAVEWEMFFANKEN